MPTFLARYATPFTTGLFLVSLISGIALFFHVGPAGVHGMHEVLSMVLILPFLLHIWKNWRAFANYFRRAPMAVALALSVVGAGYYLLPTSSETAGGNPMIAAVRAVENGTVEQVAPLFGHDPESLVSALAEQGFTTAAGGMKIIDIATTSGKGERDIMAALGAVSK